MRGSLLYARSRRIPWVIMALLAVGAAALAIGAAYVGMNEFGDMALLPTVVLGPLPAAVLVLATIDEPSREIALASYRKLQWWRLGHVAVLTVIPVVALAPLAGHPGMAWGYVAAVRNLLGYLGIGLLVGAIWGARWAWTGPLLYGLGGFVLEAQLRSGSLLYWPARPDHETPAWMAAAALTVVGAVAISRGRIGRMVDDDEAQ